MQSYESKMIVSQSEVQALKELIFNRARQRAEALANDTKTQFTTSFRDEVMDIARKSFNTNNNPFAQKINQVQNQTNNKVEKQQTVGFKQKTSAENIKEIIKAKNQLINERAASQEISGIMDNAGSEYKNTQNFTGALSFLNAQAGIRLADRNKSSFEAIA